MAQVRSIAYCGEGSAVAAGMIGPGSHYCERLARAHRSNHVFFVLDFGGGVYCQKCYDPECSGRYAPHPDRGALHHGAGGEACMRCGGDNACGCQLLPGGGGGLGVLRVLAACGIAASLPLRHPATTRCVAARRLQAGAPAGCRCRLSCAASLTLRNRPPAPRSRPQRARPTADDCFW